MGSYERTAFYARHLEVFVPKPRDSVQEESLIKCVKGLIQADCVPTRTSHHVCKHDLVDQHLSLLNKSRWENLLYGFSSYVTDGTFVELNGFPRSRSRATIWREQTLVYKFIVTNYVTRVVEDGLDRFLLPRPGANRGFEETPIKRSELAMASLHYRAICAHVVSMFSQKVLGAGVEGYHDSYGEKEVWSQEWPTVLERLKRSDDIDPIIAPGESHERWADPSEQSKTILVADYASG